MVCRRLEGRGLRRAQRRDRRKSAAIGDVGGNVGRERAAWRAASLARQWPGATMLPGAGGRSGRTTSFIAELRLRRDRQLGTAGAGSRSQPS
jgi:hypothetical protein